MKVAFRVEKGSLVSCKDVLQRISDAGRPEMTIVTALRAGGGGDEGVVTFRETMMGEASVSVLDFSSMWNIFSDGTGSPLERLFVLGWRISSVLIVDPSPADKDDTACLERWLYVFTFLLPLLDACDGDVKRLVAQLGPMPSLVIPLKAGVGMAKLGKKLSEYISMDEANTSQVAGRRNQLRAVVRGVFSLRQVVIVDAWSDIGGAGEEGTRLTDTLEGRTLDGITLPTLRCVEVQGMLSNSTLIFYVLEMLVERARSEATLADLVIDSDLDVALREVCDGFLGEALDIFLVGATEDLDVALSAVGSLEGQRVILCAPEGAASPIEGSPTFVEIRKTWLARLASLFVQPEASAATAARKQLQTKLRALHDERLRAVMLGLRASSSDRMDLAFQHIDSALEESMSKHLPGMGYSKSVYDDISRHIEEIERVVTGTLVSNSTGQGNKEEGEDIDQKQEEERRLMDHVLLASKLQSSMGALYEVSDGWMTDYCGLLHNSVEEAGGLEAKVVSLKEESNALEIELATRKSQEEAALAKSLQEVEKLRAAMEVAEAQDRTELQDAGESLESLIDGHCAETTAVATRLARLGQELADVQVETTKLLHEHQEACRVKMQAFEDGLGREAEQHKAGMARVKASLEQDAELSQGFQQAQTSVLQRVFEEVHAHHAALQDSAGRRKTAARSRQREEGRVMAHYRMDLNTLAKKLSLMEKVEDSGAAAGADETP